jgi:hypothetical protein
VCSIGQARGQPWLKWSTAWQGATIVLQIDFNVRPVGSAHVE